MIRRRPAPPDDDAALLAPQEHPVRALLQLALSLALFAGLVWGSIEVGLWWRGPSLASVQGLATALAAATEDPDIQEILARLEAGEVYTYAELLAVTDALRATHRDLRHERMRKVLAGLLVCGGLLVIGRHLVSLREELRHPRCVASPMGIRYAGGFVPHALPAPTLTRQPLERLHPRPAWCDTATPLGPLGRALLECYAAHPEWPAEIPGSASSEASAPPAGEILLLEHVLAVRARALAAVDPVRIPPPLAEAAALAHDLGKFLTFRFEGDRWVRSTPDHPRMSALLLATLPEWPSLEPDEQEDLTLAVAFHHDPDAVPVAAGSRGRDLLALLQHADTNSRFAEHEEAAASAPADPAASATEGGPAESEAPSQPVRTQAASPSAGQPGPAAPPHVPASTPTVPLPEQLRQVLGDLLWLLRINQTPFDGQADPNAGTVMLLAPALLKALAARLSPDERTALGLAKEPGSKLTVDHPAIPPVTQALADLGWLYERWNGSTASLWQVKVGRRVWPTCWLLRLQALPVDLVSQWPPSPWALQVVGPVGQAPDPPEPAARPARPVVVRGGQAPPVSDTGWDPLDFGDGIPDLAGEHEMLEIADDQLQP